MVEITLIDSHLFLTVHGFCECWKPKSGRHLGSIGEGITGSGSADSFVPTVNHRTVTLWKQCRNRDGFFLDRIYKLQMTLYWNKGVFLRPYFSYA